MKSPYLTVGLNGFNHRYIELEMRLYRNSNIKGIRMIVVDRDTICKNIILGLGTYCDLRWKERIREREVLGEIIGKDTSCNICNLKFLRLLKIHFIILCRFRWLDGDEDCPCKKYPCRRRLNTQIENNKI